jgi:hypothetical protein
LTNHHSFHIADTIRLAHGGGEGTVLNLGSGEMFALNATGSRIIELLNNGTAEPEIADIIQREFVAGDQSLTLEIHEFLSQLANLQIIVRK